MVIAGQARLTLSNRGKEGAVKTAEIRERAKSLGLQPGRMRKADLIRAIQRAEGHFDCFGTASGFCDQQDCAWRKDCLGKDA